MKTQFATSATIEHSMSFRVRLRFRLAKNLYSDDFVKNLVVHGHEVQLSAAEGEKLSDAKWLLMNAHGFKSRQEALSFAHKLKLAVQLAAASVRIGADCGFDLTTSALSSRLRELILKDTGTLIRNNIHGLDVFEDVPSFGFCSVSGQATVHANPEGFLECVATFHESMGQATQEVQDILLLFNSALVNTEPVAQIMLAISAVEMIGQSANWSSGQRALIKQLAELARTDDNLSEEDASEVADAIERGLHKISLRQGVLRLLKFLGLEHLKKEWDTVYAKRSSLVHGLNPQFDCKRSDLAYQVITLCGEILLRAIAKEIENADKEVDRYYSTPISL